MRQPIDIEVVIEAGGGPGRLSSKLGISSSAVTQWKKKRRVPQDRARKVSEITHIPLADLWPELWGDLPSGHTAPDREARGDEAIAA
jgi:DNA-binding transcriptional regulator YdaS (Cro superfamily)